MARGLSLRGWTLAVGILLGSLASASQRAVVVESVEPGLAAWKAGLRSGDRLVAWRRREPDPASAELASILDWSRLIRLEAPRGPIELSIEGRAEPVRLPRRRWGLEVRPDWSTEIQAAYRQAARAARMLQLGIAARRKAPPSHTGPWTTALSASGDDTEARLWIVLQAADSLRRIEAFDPALALLDSELKQRIPETDEMARLALLERRIEILRDREAWPEALETSRAAHAMAERLFPTSVWLARTLREQAEFLYFIEQLDAARRVADQALDLCRRLAPQSLERARAEARSGDVAFDLGDYARALAHFEQSIALGQALDAAPTELSRWWNSLALNARRLGQYQRAQGALERTVELDRQAGVRGQQLAVSYLNLGSIKSDRGDLEGAIAATRIAISEADSDDSRGTIAVVARANLLELFIQQRDLTSANQTASQLRQAVDGKAIGEFVVGVCADAHGELAEAREDFASAATWYRRALQSFQAQAKRSLSAMALQAWARVERARGDHQTARDNLKQAYELRSSLVPDSLPVASTLHQLGDLALEEGRLEEARDYLARALAIRQRLAPESWPAAETLAALARLESRRGHMVQSLTLLERAATVLDQRVEQQLSGYQARARFRAGSGRIYRQLVEVLLSLERPKQAFTVTERSRLRALLAQLAERDLSPVRDPPPELERERRAAAAAYAQLWGELERLAPSSDPKRVSELKVELASWRHRIAELSEEMRRRAAAAGTPVDLAPLDARAAARLLEAGEVVLNFSVGEHATDLLILRADGSVRHLPIPLGRAALSGRVAIFRGLLERRRRNPQDLALVHRAGRSLCDDLLGGARADLKAAKQLTVLPDGPLHLLPWAALTCRFDGRERYLVESRPIRLVSSMTLLAALRNLPRRADRRDRWPILAFGDADSSSPPGPPASGKRTGTNASRAQPLPWSLEEARSVARSGHGRLLFGSEASEAQLKRLGSQAAILHLAVHGITESKGTLESALLLAPGQGEDGRLRAWEILEELRLDADLVTLSGCETALGAELDGEGLMGLVRAFQHAGARSVIASLWAVRDDSTAALMTRFYARLASGRSRADALREAQLELLSGPVAPPAAHGWLASLIVPLRRWLGWEPPIDATHPYSWAAFQLYGDDR